MTIAEIKAELQEVFEGTPWYGNSLSTYLQEISPEVLVFTFEGSHSIGQILDHMVVWRNFVLDKLAGRDTTIEVGAEEDWEHRSYTEKDLSRLFGAIRATQKSLIRTLDGETDDLLHTSVPGKEYSFAYLLKGLIQHDIYHLGQLYLLIKIAKGENTGKNH